MYYVEQTPLTSVMNISKLSNDHTHRILYTWGEDIAAEPTVNYGANWAATLKEDL